MAGLDRIGIAVRPLVVTRVVDIREEQLTVVMIDFDVEKSLVFTGQGKVLFKPVVRLDVTYE